MIKKILLRVIAFCLSFFSPTVLKEIYIASHKIKVFKKSINDIIIFFVPEKVKLGDYHLYLNQKDSMVSGGIALGVYERPEIKLFLQLLRPEMTVVDVGANIGYYTLLAAQKVKSVIAFEPDPINFQFLTKNIQQNNCTNVISHKLAISNEEKETAFYENPDNFGDRRIYQFKESQQKNIVTSVIFDNFMEKSGITNIDMIKIDIQGAEGQALDGMKKILDQPQLHLLIEFFPEGLRATGYDPVQFLRQLSDKKFEIYQVNDSHGSLEPVTDFDKFVGQFKGKDYKNLYCKK
ncbi:MAG: FkbM family methyltransferase [Candidatus Doudnabacteria bacterium]|nr:FkbM family methyltransferase [Candidatus Doudnabacteria bacterium]